MAISTVGGWLACRSAGQYSTAIREDRGHGGGSRGGGRAGPALPHRRPPPGGDRARPHPGLRRQRGHARRHHRGDAAGPAPPGRERLGRLPASTASPTASTPSAGSLRRGATPAVLRLYDQAESTRQFSGDHFDGDGCLLLVLDEGDPEAVDWTLALVNEESRRTPGAAGRDRRLVGHWLEHRNDVSALGMVVQAGLVVDTIEVAGSWSRAPPPLRRRHRRHRRRAGHAGRHRPLLPRLPRRRLPVLHLRRRSRRRPVREGPLLPGGLRRRHDRHPRRRRRDQPPPRHRPAPGAVAARRRWATRPSPCWPTSRRRSTPPASSTRASSACRRRSYPTGGRGREPAEIEPEVTVPRGRRRWRSTAGR